MDLFQYNYHLFVSCGFCSVINLVTRITSDRAVLGVVISFLGWHLVSGKFFVKIN
jgi:hypothetical protein